MNCKCGSKRIAEIGAKCSDLCYTVLPGRKEIDGYAVDGIGIGGGDYVEFNYCLDCGQIQGTFPITEEAISEALEDAGIDSKITEFDEDGFEVLA